VLSAASCLHADLCDLSGGLRPQRRRPACRSPGSGTVPPGELADVGVEARVQLYPLGNSRRTLRLDLVRSMRPYVLEVGLASATEPEELDADAGAHLEDPRTVAVSGLLYLAWGRKPPRSETRELVSPACQEPN
jgi:hypothetical protein